MTIVQKIRLMLSSFADIKAAIEEKGGTISGVGYRHYANGVRTIYGGGTVEEYEYPKRGLIPVANLSVLIVWCGKVKEQVRQAIINGGVSCDTTVPLSMYGNKIREIEADRPLEIDTSTYYQLGYTGDEVNVRLRAVGGVKPYIWQDGGGWNSVAGSFGLELHSDGTISGTARGQDAGSTRSVEVSVTDSAGTTVNDYVRLRILRKNVDVEIGENTFVYDGKPHKCSAAVKDGDREIKGVEIGLTYDGEDTRTECGQYNIEVKILTLGYGLHKQNKNKMYITRNDRTIIRFENLRFTYDGQPHTPQITFINPDIVPTDYELTYMKHTENGKEPISAPPHDVGVYTVSCEITDRNFKTPLDNSCVFDIVEGAVNT